MESPNQRFENSWAGKLWLYVPWMFCNVTFGEVIVAFRRLSRLCGPWLYPAAVSVMVTWRADERLYAIMRRTSMTTGSRAIPTAFFRGRLCGLPQSPFPAPQNLLFVSQKHTQKICSNMLQRQYRVALRDSGSQMLEYVCKWKAFSQNSASAMSNTVNTDFECKMLK